jgi:hypothetical protein
MNALWLGRMRSRVAVLLGIAPLLLLAGGCSGSEGKVSGRVSYNGQPVTGGWVIFRPADGSKNTVNAEIDENGDYSTSVPVGEVRIAVDNEDLQPSVGGGKGVVPPGVRLPAPTQGDTATPNEPPSTPPGRYVPIPPKYYNVETSGLADTIQSGSQTKNLDLK